MNDILFQLVEEHGLKDVIDALAAICDRKARLAAADEDSGECVVVAWELDAKAIRNCLPLICNEEVGNH